MLHLQFYRPTLSRNHIARQNRKCVMACRATSQQSRNCATCRYSLSTPVYYPTIQSTKCPIPGVHCTCTAAIQHNEPLMWSKTLVLLEDRFQTNRIWFWFLRCASGQTYSQTYAHADRNTLHRYRKRSNFSELFKTICAKVI